MADDGLQVMNVSGKPVWQIREGDPMYSEEGAGYWCDSPRTLNALVEMRYWEWKAALEANDGVETSAGAVYNLPAGPRRTCTEYKIYFDEMVQQRQDERNYPPRKIRRLIEPR